MEPSFTNRNLTILVVDDTLINQKILNRKFKSINALLFFAGNGLDAIELFQKNSPDIILMDIFMPGIDGIKTTSKIREISGSLTNPIIIAVSGNSDERDIEKYKEAGMNGSLDKYFDLKDFFEILKKMGLQF